MTEFNFEPYRKMTFKSYMRYDSIEDFLSAISLNVPRGQSARIGPILWANEIAVKTAAYTATDSISQKYLEGELPVDHVEFAPMPEFKREIRLPDSEIVFTFLNVSQHTLFGPLTKWLSTLSK